MNAMDTDGRFTVGECTYTKGGNLCYTKMKVYCMRLYNKALSTDEVKANYNKVMEYRSELSI